MKYFVILLVHSAFTYFLYYLEVPAGIYIWGNLVLFSIVVAILVRMRKLHHHHSDVIDQDISFESKIEDLRND